MHRIALNILYGYQESMVTDPKTGKKKTAELLKEAT